jgi:hypothetical protein
MTSSAIGGSTRRYGDRRLEPRSFVGRAPTIKSLGQSCLLNLLFLLVTNAIYMSGKLVLVTGATGFVGAGVALEFIKSVSSSLPDFN